MSGQSINRARRRLSPLVGLLLLTLGVAGCGSESGDQVTPIASTISQAPTTTTTTTPAATTTTIPEFQVDPPSGLPPASLTEAFGGPVVIETACIDLDIAPRVIDPEELRLTLIDAFRFMGIGFVETDCDVRLSVSLQGGRYSARYGGGLEECFTGYTVEGDVAASASGFDEQWPVDVDYEPPLTISNCGGDYEPPGGPVPRYQVYGPIGEAFEALVGPIGRIAIPFGSASFRVFDFVGDPSDQVVLDALASGLYMDDPVDRCRVIEIIEGWDEPSGAEFERSDLMQLVPHLIATYLDLVEIDYDTYLSGDDGLWNCDGQTESTLWRITLEDDLEGPAEWATWWLENQGD